MTAISLHAYPLVQDRYALLPHGASIGSGYGPILVAREPLSFEQLRFAEIVVPGRMTTAFLAARLALGEFAHRELPFDRILDEVASGRADAGLVIHEGQLTYEPEGLHKVLDLGEWWQLETGPAAAARRQRRAARRRRPPVELSAVLLDSIQARARRTARRRCAYAMRFGRGIDVATADQFVGMYVNEMTCDYGDEGRRAVEELLRRGDAIGAFPEPVRLDYVS